jgi:hypothetical protein
VLSLLLCSDSDLLRHTCQKGSMGVEVRILVRITPVLLFPDRFRVKPFPLKQKKGGWKFVPKGLRAWACLLGKMVHFWKPWKHAFWSTPEFWDSFSMLSRHALSSIMYNGLECWGWAVVGSDS